MSIAVSVPSRFTPVRCRMIAGCRFVVASMSSTRSYTSFTGRPRLARDQRRVPGNHRRVLFLAAEAAAGFGLNHAHLVARQTEQHGQRPVHVVRALHRAVDRDPAGISIGHRDDAVGLDVELLLVTGAIFALDDEIGLRKPLVDVPLVDANGLEGLSDASGSKLGAVSR